MPTYVYACQKCGKVKEEWYPRIPNAPPPFVECECGAAAPRSWNAEHVGQPDCFKPYATEHMGHGITYVRSRREEQRICKERHLERLS